MYAISSLHLACLAKNLIQLTSRSASCIEQLKLQPSLLQSRSSLLFKSGVFSAQSRRYASTDLSTSTNLDPSPAPIATSPALSSPLESITENDYGLPPEQIGYLKDLGLDYGWGPTAFIQTLLEHVHIYSSTPWWASIILTALLIRLALMRAYINAADTSARMAVLTPDVAPLKAQMKVAQQNQNKLELGRLTQEVRNLYKAADVKIWKVFVPMLQVPLGFGTFRLLRGMSDLPVPGLENGGFLWLKDLTVADPYFILPLMTGLAFHVTFKVSHFMERRFRPILTFCHAGRWRTWLNHIDDSDYEIFISLRAAADNHNFYAILARGITGVFCLHITYGPCTIISPSPAGCT